VRAAVLGHVEWIDFLRVEHLPQPGEIIHAQDAWELPGGGGAVAAVQLAKLAGACTFFTALGDDDRGRRAHHDLTQLGVTVAATFHATAQRRGVTYVDDRGERTITVLGDRLGPSAADDLPWDELSEADCVYVTAADADAVRFARRARVLVATSRIYGLLQEAGVQLDALVGSALDPAEAYTAGDLEPPPSLVVRTEGRRGGTFAVKDGASQRFQASKVPGKVLDTYGAGDSFAAALTFALAEGRSPEDAIAFASRCGAAVLTGRGPYDGQIDLRAR
jgi:ribokinase